MNKTPILKHIAAFIYDLFPVVGIFILTSFIVVLIRGGEIVEQHTLWFDLLIFSELAFYYVYSWKVGGQTLGMRAWKIKVVPKSTELEKLTWLQSLFRFMIGIVSTLLLGTGLFWKRYSKSNYSWMDYCSQSKTINTND